jgi:protein TonB
VARFVRESRVFDEVTKRERGARAARRARYLVGSSAVQIAVVAGLVSASAAFSARVSEPPLVPVKIVRPAPPSPPSPSPPVPQAPPRPQAAPKVKLRPAVKRSPPAVVVQPRQTPAELEPPEPAPAPQDDGSDEGVAGGVAGGAAGGLAGGAPAPRLAAGPVKFNGAMAAPVLVSAPPLEYTQRALDHEVEGVMVVECVVTSEGVVHDCRVLRGLPFMDGAVVENLERRRYRPATLDGKPLDVQYTFTIRLRIPR